MSISGRAAPTMEEWSAIMRDGPEPHGWTVCPRCNGYGSSLEEAAPICTVCGGVGLLRKANGGLALLREETVTYYFHANTKGQSICEVVKPGRTYTVYLTTPADAPKPWTRVPSFCTCPAFRLQPGAVGERIPCKHMLAILAIIEGDTYREEESAGAGP